VLRVNFIAKLPFCNFSRVHRGDAGPSLPQLPLACSTARSAGTYVEVSAGNDNYSTQAINRITLPGSHDSSLGEYVGRDALNPDPGAKSVVGLSGTLAASAIPQYSAWKFYARKTEEFANQANSLGFRRGLPWSITNERGRRETRWVGGSEAVEQGLRTVVFILFRPLKVSSPKDWSVHLFAAKSLRLGGFVQGKRRRKVDGRASLAAPPPVARGREAGV